MSTAVLGDQVHAVDYEQCRGGGAQTDLAVTRTF